MTESLVGNLMIASTLVTDSLFARGVCLMVHHDESGAIGVMLNRPIMPPPQELLNILTSGAAAGGEPAGPASGGAASAGTSPAGQAHPAAGAAGVGHAAASGSRLPPSWGQGGEESGEQTRHPGASGMVHFGGPLSGPVVAVHGSLALAEVETGRGVYVAAQKDHLETLVRECPVDYRLIIGHAAWTAQQLVDELEAGMWHLLPATPETVFPLHDDLWPYLIRRATGASIASWVGADDRSGMAELN